MVQRRIQVSTSVADAIRSRIAIGTWMPGQRLSSINQLAQEFGVGTGSVREAVKTLASQGIIRIEHGRGMFVASGLATQAEPHIVLHDVGTGSVLALCEARRILEPELAAFAAERGSAADHQLISAQAQEMERLAASGSDYSEPDIQFHRQIALAAHNPVLARMMEGVHDLLMESRKLTSTDPGMTARTVSYHVLIADAICVRNALQARIIMLAHVNDVINSVLARQTGAHVQEAQVGASTTLLLQRSLTPLV